MVRLSTPSGVKVVSVVWVLFALLNIVQLGRMMTSTSLSTALLISISLITVLSAAYVLVGIGLWRTRLWAWRGAVGLAAVGGITGVLQGVSGLPVVVLMVLVGVYLVVRRNVFTTETFPTS